MEDIHEDKTGTVERLHEEVDRLSRPLVVLHSARLKCRRGCSSCCTDALTVYEVEADEIRRHHAGLLETGDPHPEGACAFLDKEGNCRIYEHRPYVCRTQGLPLRWIEDGEEEVFEMRDICPLNEEGLPVEEMAEEDCWTIGPFEERLADLQYEAGRGRMNRVALRDLFGSSHMSNPSCTEKKDRRG